MPIAALPQTTIRAIGSTSVISDPCSVVKELLDNALDASASSVLVEISQNTLDVIQLKDNGHGVPPDDHPFVCKHTFTSKIQTIDDLRNVGGSSLGFRGEALASVAEMSGGVTVTTRVASEVTGSCLKYSRNGELSNSQRTSHPEGTTIRITDFLKYIPVRKQAALKNATRSLLAIKKLLQSYAFAQPSKRFSLKVIKAKNENNNWVYTPAIGVMISDAATKIVGREVSSCCVVKQLSSQTLLGEDQSGCNKYQLTAFLPKPDTEITKANNAGQYVSVDGRPLSTARGIGQDIAKLFKTYVRAAASRDGVTRAISDPFLCLHVECPQGAYDVNIEPSKDDILFEDRDLMFSLLEDLFREHFGPLPDSQKRGATNTNAQITKPIHMDGSFELLMARKRPDAPALQSNANTLTSNRSVGSSPVTLLRSPDVSKNPTRVNSGNLNATPCIGEGQNSRHVNPWSISRINASFQTPRREQVVSPAASKGPRNGSPTEHRSYQSKLMSRNPTSPTGPELVSPPESRLGSSSPVTHRRRLQTTQRSPDASASTSNTARNAAKEIDRERYSDGSLDIWFRRITQSPLQENRPESTPNEADDVPTLSELARQRFGTPFDDSAQDTPAEGSVAGTRSNNLESGQSPEFKRLNRNSDYHTGSHQLSGAKSGKSTSAIELCTAGLQKDTLLQIERALDFEKRKKEAMQQRHVPSFTPRAQISAKGSSAMSHSPHRKRYLAAKAALAAEGDPFYEPTSATSFSPQDPRGYLMCNQDKRHTDKASKDGPKDLRLNTSRLPFERVPDDSDLHAICLVLPTDFSAVSQSLDVSFLSDATPNSQEDENAFSSSGMESLVPSWNDRLATLIQQQYQTRDKCRPPALHIDLFPIIKRHVTNLDSF